jgi:predicted Zn-dependent peptidase
MTGFRRHVAWPWALVVAIACLIAGSGGHAGARHASAQITRFSTERGVRVVLRQEPDSPIVAVAIAVRTLQAENWAAPGIGGVVASALFGSNSNLSREGVARTLAFVGGGFRSEWNGECATVTCITTPTMFSDTMWIVGQALKNADMDVETAAEALRNLSALRAREASDPTAIGAEAARARLFPGHPYGRSALGTPDTVRRIPRQNLLDYYRLAYAPENTVIAVCGNLDADRVRRTIASHLVDYESRAPARLARRPPPDLPEAPGAVRVTASTQAATAAVLAAYRTPGYASPDYPALRVLTTLIGGGKGSRLFRSVRDARGIGYSVGADLQAFAEAGVLYAFAEVAPRGNDPTYLDTVEQLVVNAAEGVLSNPPSDAEVERARRLSIGLHREERQRSADRALALARAELLAGNWQAEDDLPRRMAAVTASDLMETARKVLANLCVVRVVPTRRAPSP